MKSREFQNAMYDGLSRLIKALANPNRLEIIEMLSQGEKVWRELYKLPVYP
ncbi:MAG: hypothetical protein U5K79_07235 [Cyclobacteriaceae bacterium]|nr:hypothetical protein [Cyclobacteriaceae bacterium]